MKTFGLFLLLPTLLGLALPSASAAAFPEGQWTASYYSELGLGSGSQGICIQPGGTWYSDTFPAWSGTWFRRGNDVHLRGNYAGGNGNDAFELTRIHNRLQTGYWQEWHDDGGFQNFLTTSFTMTSTACNVPADGGPFDPHAEPTKSP
ncbi:MAG TPA: hypothetical protein PK413_03615 [Thermoanaerobaculia bacterium]|nr:hypothetical protein [Thermoanaerobaculia bacterium]